MADRAAYTVPQQQPLDGFDAHYAALFAAFRAVACTATAAATEFPARRRRLDTVQSRGRIVDAQPPLPLQGMQAEEAQQTT